MVRRARFRCRKTGRDAYPLDALLDLPESEVTVSLAKRALRLGTHFSFAELESEVEYQHGVKLSGTMLDEMMQAVGGVADADRKRRAEALVALPQGVAREEEALSLPAIARPKRLYISSDGVMYPTRNRQEEGGHRRIVYQEMKCGAVYWQEGTSRWHKRVLSSRDDVLTFGQSLWSLAVQCGMLQADEVIFISDGGAWCDTVARTHFSDATRILDWYHLVEHVWAAARVLYPDDQAARRWVSRCEGLLAEWSGLGLLRYLRRSRRGHEAGGAKTKVEALDVLISYVEPRLTMTDYVEYRLKGYLIGSGMMESTCKQVVGRRLKGSGRQWSEQGAVAMAALVVHQLNHTWDDLWTSRPLHRAA